MHTSTKLIKTTLMKWTHHRDMVGHGWEVGVQHFFCLEKEVTTAARDISVHVAGHIFNRRLLQSTSFTSSQKQPKAQPLLAIMPYAKMSFLGDNYSKTSCRRTSPQQNKDTHPAFSAKFFYGSASDFWGSRSVGKRICSSLRFDCMRTF